MSALRMRLHYVCSDCKGRPRSSCACCIMPCSAARAPSSTPAVNACEPNHTSEVCQALPWAHSVCGMFPASTRGGQSLYWLRARKRGVTHESAAHLEARRVVRLHSRQGICEIHEGVYGVERGHLLLLIRPLILAAAVVVPLALHIRHLAGSSSRCHGSATPWGGMLAGCWRAAVGVTCLRAWLLLLGCLLKQELLTALAWERQLCALSSRCILCVQVTRMRMDKTACSPRRPQQWCSGFRV